MRVKAGSVTRKRRKRWLKLAKGYWGHKSIAFKTAKQAVIKSWTYAYRDRKNVKREFRRLWITRINAAVKEHELNYSTFIHGLKKADIILNKKMISEIAIREPKVFEELIKKAKANIK